MPLMDEPNTMEALATFHAECDRLERDGADLTDLRTAADHLAFACWQMGASFHPLGTRIIEHVQNDD